MEISYRGLGYSDQGVRLVQKERVLQKDELLVKVQACGICGTDLHIIEGHTGSVATKKDTILGHEYAGFVERVGESVQGFQEGDLVSIDPNIYCHQCHYCKNHQFQYCENLQALGVNLDGGFAEYCFVPYKQAYKVKGEITPAEAAMMEPLACCLHGLDQLHLQPGDEALVIGGGTIGNIFAQLLQLAGLSMTVTDVDSIKLEKLKAFGIKNICNVATDCLNEQFDVIIETAGASSQTFGYALERAKKGAQILLFSVPSQQVTIEAKHIFEKELKIMGSFINPGTNEKALQLIEKKLINVKDLVSGVYKLEDFELALAAAKGHDSFKIIIEQ